MDSSLPTERADPFAEFERLLREQGIHAALRLLNERAPHRFTGIYRFDPPMLRNVFLVDAFEPSLRTGQDVPMADAYCALVGERRASLAFSDARVDDRFEPRVASAVISYCGVLLVTLDGEPFGTLCHYDFLSCDEPAAEMPMLEAAAPLLMAALRALP